MNSSFITSWPVFDLNHCMLGNFECFLSSAVFFQNRVFQINIFMNTIRVSNGLDPDQDRCLVCPDLGPNCLQRLSADYKIPAGME